MSVRRILICFSVGLNLALSCLLVFWIVNERNLPSKNFIKKQIIVDIYKSIDWDKRRFVCNGVQVEDDVGNFEFVPERSFLSFGAKLRSVM